MRHLRRPKGLRDLSPIQQRLLEAAVRGGSAPCRQVNADALERRRLVKARRGADANIVWIEPTDAGRALVAA